MKRVFTLIVIAMSLAGCAATQGWFTNPATQAVIADGCKAAALDDIRANAAMNAMMGAVVGAIPELAVVRDGLNIAHLTIQKAYADCVARATGVSIPSMPAQ